MPSERWLCLSISTRKHSPSEIVLSFLSKWFSILRHTFFSPMRVEYVPFSALILLVLVLHSSSSPVRVRVLRPGPILWGDVGIGSNSPRSECEVQIIHLDQAIHQYPSWRLCLCRLKRIKWYLVIRVQMRLTTLCKYGLVALGPQGTYLPEHPFPASRSSLIRLTPLQP